MTQFMDKDKLRSHTFSFKHIPHEAEGSVSIKSSCRRSLWRANLRRFWTAIRWSETFTLRFAFKEEELTFNIIKILSSDICETLKNIIFERLDVISSCHGQKMWRCQQHALNTNLQYLTLFKMVFDNKSFFLFTSPSRMFYIRLNCGNMCLCSHSA